MSSITVEKDDLAVWIGSRLRIAREAEGLTRQQVSAALGISRAHLSNVEDGRRQCSLPTLIKLATYFEVSLSSLFGVYALLANVGLDVEEGIYLVDWIAASPRKRVALVHSMMSAINRYGFR